jgi:hypothetical protein
MKKVVLSLLCLFGYVSYAQQTFEVNGIVYKENLSIKDKMCVTVQRKIMDDPAGYPVQSYYAGEITVPSKIEHDLDEYEVTGIAKWAFWICEGLTSLTIDEGIKRLYPYTIWGKTLTTLKLPDSLEQIDDFAINSSPGELHSVIFGKGIRLIGKYNFTGIIHEVVFTQEMPLLDCPDFLKEKSSTIVKIPSGSKDAYTKAWGELNYSEY